jgi:uncharacterized protein YcbX
MTNTGIVSLHVYPLKSARGLSPAAARLLPTGLEHDREWLIVDEHDHFVTQREVPLLATLNVRVVEDRLQLSATGQRPLTVAAGDAGTLRHVRIWRDHCAALDCGDEAAGWLRHWLGLPLRLVRFDRREPRYCNSQWAGATGATHQFADGYPVLVVNAASLHDLNTRMARALPMERFRPNIVLDDLPPWAEDRILELHTDELRLRLVKPCTRCIITTTDQSSGTRDSDEPLRTLRGFRYDAQLQGVTFGWNAIVIGGDGAMLSVGQRLNLTWRAPASSAG